MDGFGTYFGNRAKRTCCFDVDKEKEESNICHFPGRLTQFFLSLVLLKLSFNSMLNSNFKCQSYFKKSFLCNPRDLRMMVILLW